MFFSQKISFSKKKNSKRQNLTQGVVDNQQGKNFFFN
jgi:hypothetical protein